MKKIFNECYRAVVALEDADGRKRCELFRELPDRHVSLAREAHSPFIDHCFVQDYPDYYQLITQPIALSHLRKRASGTHYKDLQQYRNDWALMFNNARTYNQEGSWVYVDAVEMEKVLDATFKRLAVGSGLPGAPGGGGVGSAGSYESALTPMDDDDRPPPPSRGRSSTRRQVISDEEYLTPSDDD
jgi:ATP-dependent helicase STH1/SNF2